MKLIKPDHTRRIDIEGVPQPVRRPVDIDQSQTGFKNLRTLRIYRFDAGSVIDGHAEEDEVFIILLSGLAELSMTAEGIDIRSALLSSAGDRVSTACAAYLPPNGTYQLIAKSECDVAYVRATPAGIRLPKVLVQNPSAVSEGVTVLFEESAHAEKLRVRLLQVDAELRTVDVSVMKPSETHFETLAHFRTTGQGSGSAVTAEDSSQYPLKPWDTLVLPSGAPTTLRVAAGSSAQILVVFAAG